MHIFHSVNDSRIFGFKTGHAVGASENISAVLAEFNSENYSLVRLKVSNADESVINQIEQSGILFHWAYSVLLIDVKMVDFPDDLVVDPRMSFRQYTGENKEEVMKVIKQSFADDPIGYYRTPELAKRITKQQEVECLAMYLGDFTTDDKRIWLVYVDDVLTGFIAMKYDFEEDESIALHGGILPEHRNRGVFSFIMRNNILLNKKLGIKRSYSAIRDYNRASIWSFAAEGISPVGKDAIVHLYRNEK